MGTPSGNRQSCSSPSSSTDAPPTPVSSRLKGNITNLKKAIDEIIQQNGSKEQVKSTFEKMQSYYNQLQAKPRKQSGDITQYGRIVDEYQETVDRYLRRDATPGTDVAPTTASGAGNAEEGDQEYQGGDIRPESTINDEMCPGETPREADAKIELKNLQLKQLHRRQRLEKIAFDLNQILECMKVEDENELDELKVRLLQE